MENDETRSKNKAKSERLRVSTADDGSERAAVTTTDERGTTALRATRRKRADEKPKVMSVVKSEPQVPTKAHGTLPHSLFKGTLFFGGLELQCHVLDDGRRVFNQTELFRILSGGADGGNLKLFLRRNPLTVDMIEDRHIIPFNVPGTHFVANGYEATYLVEMCTRYLEAKEQGLLKRSQAQVVKRCEMVVRACAKVGIIALVDEATGFQEYRQKQELQVKLQAYIAEEMQEWAKVFPDDFWIQLARLEGIRYSARSRPLRWGKYVMLFVYDAIDKDVGNKLRVMNPDPGHRRNHHQWLAKYGRDRLQHHLTSVVTIMKLCNSMEDFRSKFAHVFKNAGLQLTFESFDRT